MEEGHINAPQRSHRGKALASLLAFIVLVALAVWTNQLIWADGRPLDRFDVIALVAIIIIVLAVVTSRRGFGSPADDAPDEQAEAVFPPTSPARSEHDQRE